MDYRRSCAPIGWSERRRLVSDDPAANIEAPGSFPTERTDWSSLATGELEGHPLFPLLYPRSIAVVGASPKGGFGLGVINGLTAFGFAGKIYPVNPNYDDVAGFRAYPELGAIPGEIDAVAIAVPSGAVPSVVRQAIDAGAKGGVVFGSGFAEAGDDGQALQTSLRELCGARFPLIGPNCLGLVNYLAGVPLWAITTGDRRKPGSVGLVAQSGNMALTSMVSSRGLGLAQVVSSGNQAVVDAVDVMSLYLTVPEIRVIAAVIEGLSDVAKFRRVASLAAERNIPIVALKLGRSEKASRAAVAHTGSLTGSDQLYDALFKQAGVIRVDDLEELLETAKLLSADRRPAGPGLGVFASSGGECGLIADLAAASGVELPELPASTRDQLLELLPPFANPLNPLDITASAWGNREIYGNVSTLLASSADIDIVACIGDATRSSGPLEGIGWEKMIDGLADAWAVTSKPIAVINTLTDTSYDMVDTLAGRGIIHLSGAKTAIRAIGHAGTYARWVQSRRVSPIERIVDDDRRARALSLLPPAGTGGVTESLCKEVLRLYGIPVPAGGLAGNVDAALRIANEIGYPVALKIEAENIHHKTEVGGIELGISSDGQLREAHTALIRRVHETAPGSRILGTRVERMATGQAELIIGGRNDPNFGPVVIAGIGGIMAEVLQDVSFRLAPIDATEAASMLAELRGTAILGPFRGRPASDIPAIADIIVRVSQLLTELPEIREMDLNPVMAGQAGEGAVAVDALLVV